MNCSESLNLKPISSNCFAAVVIPVRDEAEHLGDALESFAGQVDLKNRRLDTDIFEIIVLANNCADDSAEIARNWSNRNRRVNLHIAEINLPAENSKIGYVRRLLMNEAFRRLQSKNENGGIILTTDGDTRVAPDWIARNIEEIENGADAVGGRILIEDAELEKMDDRARRFHLLDEKYNLLVAEFECLLDTLPHDARPRHHQHFNGSFAVRTDAFALAGGIPAVGFLEDVAFYQALLRVDAKVRHSPHVKVFTSARNVGRSEVGLSFQIDLWAKMGRDGAVPVVESAEAIENRVLSRKILRSFWRRANAVSFWQTGEICSLAHAMLISPEQIISELNKKQTFGNLLENIFRLQDQCGAWRKENPLIPLEQAISELETRMKVFRGEVYSAASY